MTISAPALASGTGDGLEFAIDAERCIGCVACLNVFPRLFRMQGDKAVIAALPAPGEVQSQDVLQCCPVGAIRRTTLVPESESRAVPTLEYVPGWEAEWEKHRRDPEDLVERERRYGRIYHVEKLAGCALLRIELPRGLPHCDVLYMYGLAQTRPEYDCTVETLGPETLRVRARLVDPKLRHLSGKMNSFPIGLKVDYRFPEPIGATYLRRDLEQIHVYAFPAGTADPQARLAGLIREQLAVE